jgi:thiol-disulfide isomerase/thioredoxin
VLAQDKQLNDAQNFAEVAAYLQQERAKHAQHEFADDKERAIALGNLLTRVGDKLLEVAQNDVAKRTAYNFKLSAFQEMVAANVDGAQQKMDAYLKELETSDDPIARGFLLSAQFSRFRVAAARMAKTPENFEKFKTDLKQWFNRVDVPAMTVVTFGMAHAEQYKISAEEFAKEMIAFVRSPECTVSAADKENIVAMFERMLRLAYGHDPQLYGRTLDDKEFHWESLREKGKEKYVLVQFTATWCGPCQMEIPGMLEAYEKYKDKGFEIVSVYIWQREADPVATVKNYIEEKNIPWIILSEELSKKAGQPEYRETYGISGVPTMILVDKEGKIVMTQARGNALKAKLAEIFK